MSLVKKTFSIKDLEKYHGSRANMQLKKQLRVKIESLVMPLSGLQSGKLCSKERGGKVGRLACNRARTRVRVSL